MGCLTCDALLDATLAREAEVFASDGADRHIANVGDTVIREHKVSIKDSGDSLLCREDQTILDAHLRAGLWLPHSCTQGTCGTCKIVIDSGEVHQELRDEYAMLPDDIAAGRFLACQAQPRSDVTFTPGGPQSPERTFTPYPLKDFTAEVVELADVARDTRRLVLRPTEPVHFNAGQYARLHVPGTDLARDYSMANPPSEPDRLEFHIRRMPDGVASDRWIFRSLKLGDDVDLTGPLGDFHYRGPSENAILLIAGGTGLAPLKSIAQHVLETGSTCPMHLYHGVRHQRDLYDAAFFRQLAIDNPSAFSYTPCVSDEASEYSTGLVTDVVAQNYPSCKGFHAYLCGPPAMITTAVQMLRRKRVAPRFVYREEFTPPPGGSR